MTPLTPTDCRWHEIKVIFDGVHRCARRATARHSPEVTEVEGWSKKDSGMRFAASIRSPAVRAVDRGRRAFTINVARVITGMASTRFGKRLPSARCSSSVFASESRPPAGRRRIS